MLSIVLSVHRTYRNRRVAILFDHASHRYVKRCRWRLANLPYSYRTLVQPTKRMVLAYAHNHGQDTLVYLNAQHAEVKCVNIFFF